MYESSTKSASVSILPQDGAPVKSSIPSVARCRVQDESPSPLATLPTLGDEGFAAPWHPSLLGQRRKAIRPTWSPPGCGTGRGWVIRHHRARPEGKGPKGEDVPASARPGVRRAQFWLPLVVLARCVGTDPCQNLTREIQSCPEVPSRMACAACACMDITGPCETAGHQWPERWCGRHLSPRLAVACPYTCRH